MQSACTSFKLIIPFQFLHFRSNVLIHADDYNTTEPRLSFPCQVTISHNTIEFYLPVSEDSVESRQKHNLPESKAQYGVHSISDGLRRKGRKLTSRIRSNLRRISKLILYVVSATHNFVVQTV